MKYRYISLIIYFLGLFREVFLANAALLVRRLPPMDGNDGGETKRCKGLIAFRIGSSKAIYAFFPEVVLCFRFA